MPVDLADKLSMFSEHWSPKVVARLNEYEIKVVKVKGEFVWHSHDDTDEMFRDPRRAKDPTARRRRRPRCGPDTHRAAWPEHCPIADGEVHALLIEPTVVVNTGNAGGALTATYDDSLA